MAAAAECAALAEMPCVFILALGRTGSTHLLRLLNSIDGYRISGETDNAWIHFGWLAESLREAAQARGHGRRRAGGAVAPVAIENTTLCDMRRLVLQVHNPSPRARCNLIAMPTDWSATRPRPGLRLAGCLASRRSTRHSFVGRRSWATSSSRRLEALSKRKTALVEALCHAPLSHAGNRQHPHAVPTREVHFPLAQ